MLPVRALFAVLSAVVVTLGAAPAAQDAAAPGRSPRNASYTLRAALDPSSRTITGDGRLTWRNISARPATELQFHLYWNAWRDADSTWMREQLLGRLARLRQRPPEDAGWIDITRLTLSGGGDLLPQARFIAPDDGNDKDRTVLAVPLEAAVPPGGTIHVDIGWTARVPRTFARTGTIGNYFFIAHWFPKIGVLEDTGWNTHQFHAATEFFADFGVYDVTLTVPSGWIVGATGRQHSVVDHGNGTSSHRYVEADVHGFTWTTSPDFVEHRQRFESPGLPAVDMRLLLQPEHFDQVDRHFAATRAALELYGSWFGPYPYGHITVVDPVAVVNPPSQGESTGGMEYPTLFTAGTRWYAPWLGSQPEGVTVHEAGHQFFYGIVATNEFEHAWLDEGLNTYATAQVLAERYPSRFVAVERYFGGLVPWSFADVRWVREIDGFRLNPYRLVPRADVQSTPTWQYWPGTASQTSYNKTALWLGTLERMLCRPTVQRILKTHFERGAFKHPRPDEFFAIASDIAGRDLTWFFDAVHRSSAAFDYGIAQVRGSTVVARRYADGVFPTALRVTFADGSMADASWDGREPWRAFTFPDTRGRIVRAELDPDRTLLLDLNYTNNSWTAHPRGAEAARRWSLRWLTWLQELMLTYAFFA
jgi:hypothetical protein